jgi:hypothetical protein
MIFKLQLMRLGIIESVVLSEGWAIVGNIEDRDKVNALIKEHGCIRDTPGRIDVLFATYVTHDGIAMKSFEEVKHGNKVADYIPRQDHECSGETEFGGDYVTLLPPRGFDIKSIPESGLEMIDSFLSRHSKTTMKGDF